MKLTPVSKNEGYNFGLNDDGFFDNWIDFPFSKFGKNMQKMKTDVVEMKDNYLITIDIPGYDKNDINIHVGENYLTVYAKKDEETAEKEDKEGKYVYRERYFGTCSRSFYIGNLKEENIRAKYQNGTLTITLPKEQKSEKDSKKYINIE